MPEQVYHVTDPETGKSVTLRGDAPPSEEELNQIFAAMHGGPKSGLPPEHVATDAHPLSDSNTVGADEPGTFMGGFLKRIKDDVLGATAGNPKFQDMAAPVSNLGGVMAYTGATPTVLPGMMQKAGGAMAAAGDALRPTLRRGPLQSALEYSILRPILGDKWSSAATAAPYAASGGGRALKAVGEAIDPAIESEPLFRFGSNKPTAPAAPSATVPPESPSTPPETPQVGPPPIKLAPNAMGDGPMAQSASQMMQEGVNPTQPLGMPRVTSWKDPSYLPDPQDAAKLRELEGSRDAAKRLAISQDDLKLLAPRTGPGVALPTAVQGRLRQAVAGMSPEQVAEYLRRAPNGLARDFLNTLTK